MFRTDPACQGRSNRSRTRNRLASAPVTNNRCAFLSSPWLRTLVKPNTRYHPETALDLGPHLRLGAVACLHRLVHRAAMPIAAVGEIQRVRRGFTDHPALLPIRLVTPHPCLIAVQQVVVSSGTGSRPRPANRRIARSHTAPPPLQTDRRAALAGLRIDRLDQSA